MRIIEVNPVDKNNFLGRYEYVLIVTEAEMEASRSVGVTYDRLGYYISSVTKEINPQKKNYTTKQVTITG